jgi:hypothetical protein
MISVKAPVSILMEYAEMVSASQLATYANLPAGPTATEVGHNPAENGEPVTAVNAPVVASMLKAEMLSDTQFVTYTQ